MKYEELCQKIIEGTQEAVIFADHEEIIRLWNVGAEVMFGYRADEAIGQSLDVIIPERQRARHWQGYHQVMKTGVTRYGRELLAVPAVRKDGTRISLEFTIVLLRNDAGGVIGSAALLRDVTARCSNSRLREKARKLGVGARKFLRFAKL